LKEEQIPNINFLLNEAKVDPSQILSMFAILLRSSSKLLNRVRAQRFKNKTWILKRSLSIEIYNSQTVTGWQSCNLLLVWKPLLPVREPAGIDVMITIFANFRQFFQKSVLWSIFSQFSFVLSQNRQFFRRLFWWKYLKNHNIGPWRYSSQPVRHWLLNLCLRNRPGGSGELNLDI
jgi:hypothetical protein